MKEWSNMKKSVQFRNTHMPNAFGSIGMVFQLIATLGLGRKMGPNLLLCKSHLNFMNKIFHFLDTLCSLLIWGMTKINLVKSLEHRISICFFKNTINPLASKCVFIIIDGEDICTQGKWQASGSSQWVEILYKVHLHENH